MGHTNGKQNACHHREAGDVLNRTNGNNFHYSWCCICLYSKFNGMVKWWFLKNEKRPHLHLLCVSYVHKIQMWFNTLSFTFSHRFRHCLTISQVLHVKHTDSLIVAKDFIALASQIPVFLSINVSRFSLSSMLMLSRYVAPRSEKKRKEKKSEFGHFQLLCKSSQPKAD